MAADACTPPSAPSPGSIFDDEWSSFAGDTPNAYENLDHLDLDDILGPVPKTAEAEGTINPQVLGHPEASRTSFDVGRFVQGLSSSNQEDNIVVGATRNREPFDHHIATSPPAFHHSIEGPQDFDFGHYIPSPLSNQLNHRRSVSEPPAALPTDNIHAYGIPPLSQPAMTFHRSGTPLGTPLGTPKVDHGNRIVRNRHPRLQEPYPPPAPRAFQQERYHLRRSHTQPMRRGHAPTSVPAAMRQGHYASPAAVMMQPQMHAPVHVGSPAVTSRVCTPAPSPPQPYAASGRGDVASVEPTHVENKPVIAIPLTIEELRGMIAEAVKTALSDTGVRASIERADGSDVEGETD